MRMALGLFIALVAATGCQSTRSAAMVTNPTAVAAANYDAVWETTIDELQRYFQIAYENRYDGRIETFAESSPSVLEPWRGDVGSFQQRVEATLQTIRRRGFILIQPAPTGGYAITLEIYKELEHLPSPISARNPNATLIQSVQPIEETLVRSAVAAPAGWISLGRDTELEGKILARLERRLGAGTFQPVAEPIPASIQPIPADGQPLTPDLPVSPVDVQPVPPNS